MLYQKSLFQYNHTDLEVRLKETANPGRKCERESQKELIKTIFKNNIIHRYRQTKDKIKEGEGVVDSAQALKNQ